jgi:thiamine biosynthesis lipoprotein
MGAPFEMTVFAPASVAWQAMQAAFAEIARIEALLSIFRPDSEISRLNRSGKGWVRLDPEACHVLALALEYANLSDGAYDPTAGALIDLFGFGSETGCIEPPSDVIAETLSRVGFRKVAVRDGGVERQVEGMTFNLGGIGKGYAIDRAVARLQAGGIARGRVHCGSTTFVFGEAQTISIAHPLHPDCEVERVVLRDAALSTSSNAERIGHLIDPRSGRPARGILSASVIAPTAAASDALSTALFVQGSAHFLDTIPETAGWLMTDVETIQTSSRWAFHRPTPRRRFIAVAAGLLVGLLLPWKVEAATVYFTEKEALSAMMPDADRLEEREVVLSAEQKALAGERAGRGFREDQFRFQVGYKGDALVGHALVLDVIGKERPITFMVGIAPDGTVIGVEVLIYRESEGSQVRSRRFTGQFRQKKWDDPLRLGSDIQPISGATLSSRAATYAVRKTLAIFSVIPP